MDAQREMTLDEWVGTLPPIHSARTELEALRRQLAEAEGELQATRDDRETYAIQRDAAEAKLALAEQDARRYQWLAGNVEHEEWDGFNFPYISDIRYMPAGQMNEMYETIDAAIDAAIAAGEGES